MNKLLLFDCAGKQDSMLKSRLAEMECTVFSLLTSSLVNPDDVHVMGNDSVFYSYDEMEFNAKFDALFTSSLLNSTLSENMDVSLFGDGEYVGNIITEGL
ncbi:hypothetical protein [Methanolobus sp. ZRKC5]|uniref:hypothetical protein n=1 Tax=unclassified Methanolobus TaxID=2629569 RepID=UPI00313D70C4